VHAKGESAAYEGRDDSQACKWDRDPVHAQSAQVP
jgi:hypothetical protein